MTSQWDGRVKQLVNVGVLIKTMARQANGREAIVDAQDGWRQENNRSKRASVCHRIVCKFNEHVVFILFARIDLTLKGRIDRLQFPVLASGCL